MQPHFPFLGSTGQELEKSSLKRGEEAQIHPWEELMRSGSIDDEKVLQAYKENHKIVASKIPSLINSIKGKHVISSDHANLIGERTGPIPLTVYGHPRGFHKRQLIEIPWVEVPSSERRLITNDPPVGKTEIKSDTVSDRLDALGYAD